MASLFKVMAVSRPQFSNNRAATSRTKLRPADVERSVKHAQNLCYAYEDAPECKVAWDRVEELSSELARQHMEDLTDSLMCQEDPLSCRIYDL